MEHKIRKLFHAACAKYNLLENGDRILVALSGGKDSLELVRLMGQQQRILKPKIFVEAVHVVMDNIPYKSDTEYLTEFCSSLGVPLTVLHASFEQREGNKKPMCFMCSWNRRKTIFKYATEQGFNKVALGHHQDDVLVTFLMNIFYEGSIQTMPPALKMKYYDVTLIRPMCMVHEWMIKEFAKCAGFKEQIKSCPYERKTKRVEIEELFKSLEKQNGEIRYSLWSSMNNIRVEMLPRKKC